MQLANEIVVPLITVAAANYLPGGSSPVFTLAALQLGRALGPALESVFHLPLLDKVKALMGFAPRKSLVIEADNALYLKFEAYLIRNHLERFRDCQLAPRRGDVAFALNNALLIGPIWVKHDGLELEVSINKPIAPQGEQDRMRGQGQGLAGTGLRISTSCGSLEQLRDFVTSVCQRQERESSQQLHIYHTSSRAGKKKKEHSVYWEELEVVTNRNLGNTIVDVSVQKELLQDVEWFLGAEAWYNAKGIPYKRGYLLHGPPGTGKTSIVKALAVEYGLPIFSVDLSIVDDNSELIKLITEIAYLSRNQRYILSFEDMDRSKIFDRYHDGGLTMDCLLNILDGIAESYGRVLFLSVNDRAPLEKVPALLRPGRVDKMIEITFVTASQLNAMLEHFYQRPFELTSAPASLAPAQVINVMQKHPDDAELALEGIVESIPADELGAIFGGGGARRNGKSKNRAQQKDPIKRKQAEMRDVQRKLKRQSAQINSRSKRLQRSQLSAENKMAKLQTQLDRLKAQKAQQAQKARKARKR